MTYQDWRLQAAGLPTWEDMMRRCHFLPPLSNIPQDPVWHAEGDVLTHTQMVVAALEALPAFQEMEEQEQQLLWLAALLHDYGKLVKTKTEGGRIVSPGHAKTGARMARYELYKGIPEPIPFAIREMIVQLVRLHGLPVWFLEKQHTQHDVVLASEMVSLHQLALLAEADFRGRVSQEQSEWLLKIDLFREYAQEQQCYQSPYPFQSGLHRFDFAHRDQSSPLYVPYDETAFEVILMSGLPGAGKDHWILEHGRDLPLISLDGIRKQLKIDPKGPQGKVVHTAKQLARDLLRQQQPFIWNATNITQQMRSQLVELFTTYKARVKIIYVEADHDRLLQQNAGRTKQVPGKVMDQLIQKWEVPMPHEAHDVESWIDGEKVSPFITVNS